MHKIVFSKSVLSYLFFATFFLFHQSCSFLAVGKKTSPGENFAQESWLAPNILNSERIKRKFGSFGVSLLKQDEDAGIRVSNLYSEHDGERFMRALAFVHFSSSMDERLKDAHQEILSGGSIGTTLVKHGLSMDKRITFKGLSRYMPNNIIEAMKVYQREFATVTYELVAKDGDKNFSYCTITEIYSPTFLSLEDVEQIYANEQKINDKKSLVSEKLALPIAERHANENLRLIKETISSLSI